jgi:Holliday junction resolvase-like predicted endonuclease
LYAILTALQNIDEIKHRRFTISSDSKSAIQIIDAINNDHPIATKIQMWIIRLAARKKSVQLCWVPSHINVAGNETADQNARNAAMSDDEIDFLHIPHRDYYSTIKKKCTMMWQNEWYSVTNNKLRSIEDTIRVWLSSQNSVRRVEVVLTRLRIGHTKLTHGFLMESRHQTYCSGCLVPLTVHHILVECPEYSEERRMCFPVPGQLTISEVLAQPQNGVFNTNRLLQFLRNTNLMKEI